MLTAGLGGIARDGCVALGEGDRLVGVCQQERVTRVRGAGFNRTGLPDEALDLLLERAHRQRSDVQYRLVAEGLPDAGELPGVRHVDHHFGHACAAYLSSPFTSATVIVCDHDASGVSVWQGRGAQLSKVEWPWHGPSFVDVYSDCASLIGLGSRGGDQRMEALARLHANADDDPWRRLLRYDGSGIAADPSWRAKVADAAAGDANGDYPRNAALAATLQARIIGLLLEFLQDVRRETPNDCLCLSGSLFYHSSINAAVRSSALFNRVFVPINPGNAGLAVGLALHAGGLAPQLVSPFLGPAYSAEEIKETLDNCKLQYTWESEENAIALAVRALRRGHLVGWYDGPMEWGPRALGGRSILASPFCPFVLENLNRFLKRREPWRGYALTGLPDAVRERFQGPDASPFMECDYRPLDRLRFRHVLPSPQAAIRVQTLDEAAPPRFRRLLEAFGAAEGLPLLVNTSFNGFHEPIVCTPRDAVRVFFGSGLDLLVLDRFVVTK